MTAFAPLASADSRILLDLSNDHVVLIQGDSANVTLTIDNNDTSIQDYDLVVDDSSTSSAWNVTLADETLSTVLPTFSVSTTIIVHLAIDADLSDSGSVQIDVSHSGTNVSTSITLYLSVAPSYLPNIEHTVVGDQGLISMEIGESIDLDVPISNLGSSLDHIVLAVNETADLADFWANWNGGSSNNSGNNSGGNNSGGNNSGGNNSGNNTNPTGCGHEVNYTMLMAYTSIFMYEGNTFNSWLSTHCDLINTTMMIDNSITDLNNATIASGNISWVGTSNSTSEMWNVTGLQVGNYTFTSILSYQSNGSWNHIETDVTAFQVITNNSGGNQSGNGTNGTSSGPTELFAALSAVGTNLTATLDSVNLTSNHSYVVDWTLEENGSLFPHDVGVYNWTSNGTNHTWTNHWNVSAGDWCISATLSHNLSAVGNATTCMTVSSGQGGGNGTTMGRSVPTGWDVRWLTSTFSNMSAGESQNATLRISVPNGEAPGDYGFLLSAGSAMGNFTISETIVVRVNGTHNLTMSATESTNNWLPNATGMVDFEVHNSGTSEAESIYSISTSGACTASLDSAEADGDRLLASDNESISIDVNIDSAASEGDTCDLTLDAWDEIGEVSYSHTHTIMIGVSYGLEVVSNEALSLSPGGAVSGTITIRNTGTETTSIRLTSSSNDLAISTDSSYVAVHSGETIDLTWSTSTASDTSLVGNYSIALSAVAQDGSATLNFSGTINVLPWSSIWMTGPLGGAFDVGANSPTSIDFTLTNDGTGPALASLDWSGAPAGFTISVNNATTVEPNGNQSTLSMNVAIDDDIASGSYSFTVLAMNPTDGISWDSLTIQAQVDQRAEVRLLVAGDSLPVSNAVNSVYVATVINDGNEQDTFAVTLTGAAGFEVGITPQTLTLTAGESGEVNISLRRTGAADDVTMTLTVESENDDSVNDSLSLFATVPSISVQSTVTTNIQSIPAEGNAILSLFLANLGEAEDTLLVTGPSGFTCDHPTQVTLAAGSVAQSYTVSCVASSGLLAGMHTIAFTATSLSDSSVNSTDSVDVEILPQRNADGSPMLEVSMIGDDWSLPWNSSATYTVTIRNDGNEQVNGFLRLAGEYANDLSADWNLVDQNLTISIFSVAPRGVSTYSLTLTPIGEPTVGTVEIRIEASGTLSDGQGFAVNSESKNLDVEFEAPTPTEAELWSGGPMVNAANLAIAMLSGWLFAGLLIMWMRFSSKARTKKNAQDAWDEAIEEESKDDDLKHGEIRADEDETARCHACESRIRLPTNKEPPFRFKCPTCEAMNRVMPPREE